MSSNRLQNSKYQSCIDACNACAESCELCAISCLREEDVKTLSRCIQLDRDCASLCWTASQLMSRVSEYAKQNKSTISVRNRVMPVLKNVTK
jgi:ferredoxin